MVDSHTSLFERIQARLNNKNSTKNTVTLQQNESESESDVDDDITLDECVDIVERKPLDSSFTKILRKENTQSSVEVNLRDIVAKRKKNSVLVVYDESHKPENNRTATNIEDKQNSVHDIRTENVNRGQSLSTTALNPTNETKTIGCTSATASSITTISPRTFSGPDELEADTELPCAFVKKKRACLTEKEKQEAKRKKEDEKLEKQKKKEEIKIQRELEKVKAKAAKKANTLNNRNERKDECMEKMLAVIDPGLIEGAGGADILKSLQDVLVAYQIKSLPISCCIGWMKENATFSVNQNSEISKSVTYEEANQILHVITANELAIRVNAETSGDNEEETLRNLLKELKEAYPMKKITILLTGLKAYYRLFKTNQNRQFRNQALGVEVTSGTHGRKRKKKTIQVPVLEKKDVESLLVEVQTLNEVFFRKCDEEKDVGEFVASFTKAIAEAPFKKTSNASLQFCAIAPSDKQSVKVMDDGRGIHELWNQQLQQFYGVRHETSIAITQHYPTPRSLMEAYANESKENGPRLLQDIEIRRGVGVLQTHRRVGPELSKRVYKLMTSTNGEELLAR